MKKFSFINILLILCIIATGAFAAGTSTINPAIPAQSSPLSSAPIRSNFLAAYNDINTIYGQISALGTLGPGGLTNQIQYKTAGNVFGGFTMSGDCGLTVSTGAIVCTSTNGTPFPNLIVAGVTGQTFPASGQIVGTTDTQTLTHKTYDTAGAGNVFSINGTQVSAVTGTGNTAVLANNPTGFTGTMLTTMHGAASGSLGGENGFSLVMPTLSGTASGTPFRGLTVVQTTTSSSGSINQSDGVYVSAPSVSGSGSIISDNGVHIANQGAAGISNAAAISIDAQSGATNNYAINYNNGLFLLDSGGNLTAKTGSFSSPANSNGTTVISLGNNITGGTSEFTSALDLNAGSISNATTARGWNLEIDMPSISNSTVSEYDGIYIQAGAAIGTTTITKQSGIYIQNQGSSKATNTYGILIDTQSGSTSNSDAINYSSGAFKVDTSANITGVSLAVTGSTAPAFGVYKPFGSGTGLSANGVLVLDARTIGPSNIDFLGVFAGGSGNGVNLNTLSSTDTNAPMTLNTLGTGGLFLCSGAGCGLEVDDSGGATANHITAIGGTTGNPAILSAVNSSDSNVSISVVPKGNGNLRSPAIVSNGTKFTTSGCSVSATTGGASAGKYTSGTTGTCTVTITMGGATGNSAPNGWSCWANDETTPADKHQTISSTATTAVISGTTISGDVIDFGCMGF